MLHKCVLSGACILLVAFPLRSYPVDLAGGDGLCPHAPSRTQLRASPSPMPRVAILLLSGCRRRRISPAANLQLKTSPPGRWTEEARMGKETRMEGGRWERKDGGGREEDSPASFCRTCGERRRGFGGRVFF